MKKYLFIPLLILAVITVTSGLPQSVYADSIAFDTSAVSTTVSSGTDSFTYTTGSGTNRFMIVQLFDAQSGGGDNVVSVKYNGVAMTELFNSNTFPTSGKTYDAFYLYGPATGANTVLITYTSPQVSRVVVATYSGAKQSGFPDASSSTFDSSGATVISTTATPSASGAWGILFGVTGSTYSSTNYTLRQIGITGNIQVVDTNGTISGSTNMTITQSLSSSAGGKMYSLAPAASTVISTQSDITFFGF